MLTAFGQFLDHDITLTPESREKECCERGEFEGECFQIYMADCDIKPTEVLKHCKPGPGPRYGGDGGGSNFEHCLHFSRSVEFCHSHYTVREQMNGITAFVDASTVYGSEYLTANILRDGDFLKYENVEGEQFLPVIKKEETAGDGRARENPTLMSMHTIFSQRAQQNSQDSYPNGSKQCV